MSDQSEQNPDPQGSPMARALLRSQQRSGPSRRAMVGSIVLHGLLGATVVASAQIQPAEKPMDNFRTFRVEIFSPPPQVEGEPTPPKELPKSPIVKQVKAPEPKPKAVAKQPAPPKKETGKAVKPQTTKAPVRGRNARPGPVGGENLNVLQEGEEFPYPEYLGNVVTQINRYFRWNGAGNLEAEVGFYIRRDGSISGLRVYRRSGEIQFDLSAADAVNAVAKARGFGALPDGFDRDSLGVLFRFLPPNK